MYTNTGILIQQQLSLHYRYMWIFIGYVQLHEFKWSKQCHNFFYNLPTIKQEKPEPSTSTDEAGPSSAVDDDRPDCKYWEKCYRKEPNHIKQFRHPADGPPKKANRVKPENKIEDGDEKSVAGGFRLKRIGSHYTCTWVTHSLQGRPFTSSIIYTEWKSLQLSFNINVVHKSCQEENKQF